MQAVADTDAAAPQEAEDAFEQLRASPRDSMFLMATLRRADATAFPVKVRNLSTGGLMAEAPVNFWRDEAIEIDLRGIGVVSGRIAWAAGGRIGVAFDRAVDPLLARKPVTGQPQPQLLQIARTHWRPGFR